MKILTLPNLINQPDITVNYVINKQQYTFHYLWCDSFCLLDIYKIVNNVTKYLVKGRAITTDSDILSRVKDSSLSTGSLVYVNKYNQHIQPDQSNFNTDFYLIYIPEDEKTYEQ